MRTDVYVDLYFLVNASMDLLCLATTAAILHRPMRRWRLLVGAALGGVWSLTVLLGGLDGALGVLLDLLAAILLCAVAFSERGGSAKRLLQSAGAFALLSALMGGLMTVLYRFLNRLELPFEALQGDDLSAWMLALLAAVAGIVTLHGGRLLRRSVAVRDVLLEITVEGRSTRLHALVDTGDLLTDPLSGRSVVLVDPAALTSVLPPGLAEALAHPDRAAPQYARRLRLIPTHTATGDAMLVAFAPDRLVVITKKERSTVNDLIAPVPLGDTAHGFDALIARE